MAEAAEEKRRSGETLGWLTESSIMPKKHKPIEGVGASSIMELKAQLYMGQEESKMTKELSGVDVEFHRAKRRPNPRDPDRFSVKNSGVDSRSHKDKLALKAEKDGSVSYAALEKKAELYEKLVNGELSDEEDKEKYCVDFFSKGFVQDKSLDSQAQTASDSESLQKEDDKDDGFVPFDLKAGGLGRTSVTADHSEHKRFVREVHEEVNQAREKASELKLRRQEQAAARREKLKQAYIRKQLEKLKASASNGEMNDQGS